MLIQVDGVPRPISMTNCDTLLPVLSAVLGSWRFRPIAASKVDPVISIRRTRTGFRIKSPWLEEPAKDGTEVGAVCCLAIDLVQAYVERDPSMLCLHCAAVEIDGRLVVFPSTVRAGKSTLVTRLASMGHRIYADDLLPIVAPEDNGLALGTAPRLRRPLPPASAEFSAFVDAHSGPGDDRYLYLSLTAAMLAPHGSTAPLGACVLLDRRPSVAAELVPTTPGSGLRQLIAQSFVQREGLISSVERLAAVVERLRCFTLVYSDVDEASELLRVRFSGWNMRLDKPAARSEVAWAHASRPARLEQTTNVHRGRVTRARRFVQASDVHLKDVRGDLFLVRLQEDGVFHLNPVAAALWRLLEHPTTEEEAAGVLSEAFPDIDPRRIKRDVHSLFDALRSARLVQVRMSSNGTRLAPRSG